MLPCIQKCELKTFAHCFSPIALLFPSLEIMASYCDFLIALLKVARDKSTWPTFSLRLFLHNLKEKKKIRVHSENNNLSCTTLYLYSQVQSTVTAFEDVNQSDSEIIDLGEKCMNGFLSICSNLWLAPNRKLSNISDSDPPTNRCVKSHS